MASKPLIVGLGEILWDFLPTGKQLGGAPANFAYHADAQGGNGMIVSCIGDDLLGQEIVNQLQQLGLMTQYIAIDKEHPTGTVSIELDEEGKATYIIHNPVAWDFLPNGPERIALAEKTDAVCFGSLAQRSPSTCVAIRAFLTHVPEKALKIFDVNLRQNYYNLETITAGLELANVLKLNDKELPVIAKMLSMPLSKKLMKKEAEITTLRALEERFQLDLIALTKGGDGAMLVTPTEVATHPGVSVNVVDTVGAGDSFTAALALGLLKGNDLVSILDHATCVAAFVCSSHGATPDYSQEQILL